MRSGMRSWSKWVIFSRRMKSLSSAGPRRPALSEAWLSATGTPWLVVRPWPALSASTRPSSPLLAFTPGWATPVLALVLASLRVLAPTIGGASTVLPALGRAAAAPNSLVLLALNGHADTVCATAWSCCAWVGEALTGCPAVADGCLAAVFLAATGLAEAGFFGVAIAVLLLITLL